MLSDFLPAAVNDLTEPTSIAFVQAIQCQPIVTSLSPSPISTTYVHQGAGGVPMLLLNGFDSSLLEFRRLLPLLATAGSTWAIDLLGFGFTERPHNVSFTPQAIKTHLYQFWQEKLNQPVVLVGASMGGAAAIDFALTFPDCVQKLVLIDSAGFATSPVSPRLMVPPLDRWAAAFLRSPRVRRRISVQAYWDRTFVTPDAEICASVHLQCPRWQEALIAFAKSGGYDFLHDHIPQVHQPTLILWGEQDRIMNHKDAGKFKGAIANSHLIWIPHCGHVPHLEKPQLTAEHILAFLTEEKEGGDRQPMITTASS